MSENKIMPMVINKPANKTNDNSIISKFTDDQRKAYIALLDFIRADYDSKDFKRALCGPAGTGKTFLVRALLMNCGLSFGSIGLAAPTHKACRVLANAIGIPQLKVNTLQSDLGLRLNFNVDNFDISNPPFDPKGKVKIKNYSIYIVDEASMIADTSYRNGRRYAGGLRTYLEKICLENKCKIIYIGDSFQLPPVNEKTSSAFNTIKIYNLKEVVRQGDDNPVSRLLDYLRYDIEHKTTHFLNYIVKHRTEYNSLGTKGYEVVDVREFTNKVNVYFNDEKLTKDVDYVKLIGYTNDCVTQWNNYIRNTIIADANKCVITKNDLILSYVTLVDEFNSPIIKNSEDYILKDVVNYTHSKYDIKGFMVRFISVFGGKVTQPLFVLDHTDKYSLIRYIQVSNAMINEAKHARTGKARLWAEYFKFKDSCLLLINIKGTDGKTMFTRDLDYGFALTSHKSQGSTFDTVLVNVRDIVYDKYGQPRTDLELINRLLYVACSRCKNKLIMNY